MLGLALAITPPGGSSTDYTRFLIRADFKWPATTDLPTCQMTVDNSSGIFASSVPLFSVVKLTFPNGLGPYYFYLETVDLNFVPQLGQGIDSGHMAQLTCTAAPELLYLTEGNLDVVGTDISVGEWNARGTFYVPYRSNTVASLNTNLLDIGYALNALLGDAQPGQSAGYAGRLGYDATGAGISSTGTVWSQSASTGWSPNGLYYKGQWKVGLGSTGAQKTGLDIIKDLLTTNLIDNTGSPQWVDWYIDCSQSPPVLKAFIRASNASSQTFVVGTDPVYSLDLPVDSASIKNFVIYWANPEVVYPNSGDAWSNYATNSPLQAQWALTTSSGTGTETTDSSNTATGSGFSNKYTNTTAGLTSWDVTATFALGPNGYQTLSQSVGRGMSALNFYFYRQFAMNAQDGITPIFSDGTNVIEFLSMPALPPATTWQQYSIPIPVSGNGSGLGWNVVSGSWDFAVNTITKIEFIMAVGGNGAADNTFWLDQINFSENWQFSPVYSWNFFAVPPTTLSGSSAANTSVLSVNSTSTFVSGMTIVVNSGGGTAESRKIISVNATALTINVNEPFAFAHAANELVTGPAGGAGVTTLNANTSIGDTTFTVSSGSSYVVGQSVIIDPTVTGTHAQEIVPISAISGQTLTIASSYNSGSGLIRAHLSGATVVGATHDPNSISAYQYRLDNYVDFYLQTGSSDGADSIANNILTTRKSKSSSGTITVSGYSPKVPSIKPGYVFSITDPTDVYIGSATTDSAIGGWIADQVEYIIDTTPGETGGFRAVYTVEPYYASITTGSPDRNTRDVAALANRDPAKMLAVLNRMQLPGGRGSIRGP